MATGTLTDEVAAASPKRTYLRLRVPSGASAVEFSSSWRAAVLMLLSAVETTPGVGRFIRTEVDTSDAGGPTRLRTYLLEPRFGRADLEQLRRSYRDHLERHLPGVSFEAHACEYHDTEACEVCAVEWEPDYDYTTATGRLQHTCPTVRLDRDLHGDRILEMAAVVDRLDPGSVTDYDTRRNVNLAHLHGCEDIKRAKAREPTYGEEHELDRELKTRVYDAETSSGSRFTAVVNFLAKSRGREKNKVHLRRFRRALQNAGHGTVKDTRPSNIEARFGLRYGEVHPALLLPKLGSGNWDEAGLPIVHVYDRELTSYGYVATNGGNGYWTTEFRRDRFVERMLEAYAVRQGEPSLVIVADIIQGSAYAVPVAEPSGSVNWTHRLLPLTGAGSDGQPVPAAELRPGFVTGDGTVAFIEMLQAALEDAAPHSTPASESMELRVIRSPELDFHLVKFPQCWRTVFQEVARAVASAVRHQVYPLFVDCNIMPAQELLGDRMLPDVRELVVAELRRELAAELSNVADADLIRTVQARVGLIPKSTLVTEAIRDMVASGEVTHAFLVGGAQVSDPALSIFRDALGSIDGLEIRALGADLIRAVRRAMFFEEQTDANAAEIAQKRKVEEVYLILSGLLPEIAAADRPMVVLSSTSLCQAYRFNGDVLIPEDLVTHLAKVRDTDITQVEAQVAEINRIRVVSTTELYARRAAELLHFLTASRPQGPA